jgi:hypothetical protein
VNDNVIDMAENFTQDQLVQALHKYGDRWCIQQNEDRDGWTANACHP